MKVSERLSSTQGGSGNGGNEYQDADTLSHIYLTVLNHHDSMMPPKRSWSPFHRRKHSEASSNTEYIGDSFMGSDNLSTLTTSSEERSSDRNKGDGIIDIKKAPIRGKWKGRFKRSLSHVKRAFGSKQDSVLYLEPVHHSGTRMAC